MTGDVMIEASALTKRYGAVRALDKVSFEVHRGEVVGFLGPNGAGKSTTMRILTCFISASSGAARVHGYDVFDEPLEVRRKLGYLPQRAPLYGEMSVWEYLSFVADMRNLDRSVFRKRMKGVVEVCGLAQSLGRDIRTLSHGYRQRVGLAQALVHDPPILILDEPTSDLDPNEKAEVIRYIKEIGKERTILLSTHNLSEVETACARAIIVSKGRVVADGNLDDVRARSGKVRYVITVHEQKLFEGGEGNRAGSRKPPSAEEVQEALRKLPGVTSVSELPTDDRAHSFQLLGALGQDIRPELFALIVQKGWLLLEMRRDSQSLEDVFKALTKGDERRDRGRPLVDEDEEGDDDAADDEETDEDGSEDGADEDDGADEEAEEGPRAKNDKKG
ncbi:ATP-binding cassette domain-containing protein [Chondromyces apiculatus]|uniref:ABC transporter, ATP-binding protein n=1 Tax=Chondromyces apiculatus DSM 436 TaxID=1192034 RepID=A0A017T2T4_9BACT|nr:ATP-binding cassette domain-containing protein [Chondromyces apiculatus]EYF03534.1 ABC transporter, ATP-binding protein [Chondromyces apiculatus DSM 436]